MSAAKNNKQNRDGIDNAEEVIQRFGGIRPMANKMDVPVTTVQGWKKRNVIPGNRIDEVLKAAQHNDVDLSGITIKGVANENEGSGAGGKDKSTAKKSGSFKDEVKQASAEQGTADIDKHEKAIEAARIEGDEADRKQSMEQVADVTGQTADNGADPKKTVAARHDVLMKEIKKAEHMAVKKSVWVSTALVALALTGAAILLMPGQKKVAELDSKTQQIGADVEAIKTGNASLFKGLIPEGLQANIEELQGQAKRVQDTVSGLSSQVEGLAQELQSGNIDALAGRVKAIEAHIVGVTGVSPELVGFMDKLGTLKQSTAGQEQLRNSFGDLYALVTGLKGDEAAASGIQDEQVLAEALKSAQTEDDALGQTLDGVSQSDLKAAAMLLTLSQIRTSLNRSEPFEEDLILMQELLGGPEKNPELTESINRLAPKASDGVLTPDGLKGQFKDLAGDIVVASLKGEDVSIQEKAQARLNEIMQVEKDGELVTGTDTQATVARAQKMLDEGNIEGAIAELQGLEGEAAQTAQPFIDEAMMTMMAQQFQSQLTGTVMNNIGVSGLDSMSPEQLDFKALAAGLKNKVMKGTIVQDDESGFSILVPNKKASQMPAVQ